MMNKYFFFFAILICHQVNAASNTSVTVSNGALQPNTAVGINISSGTIHNFNADSGNITNLSFTNGTVPNSALNSSVTLLGNGNIVFPGVNTNSHQPTFMVFNSAERVNVTGDSTQLTVPFDMKVIDNTSNFSGNTFTAPVTGNYLLMYDVYIKGTAAGNKCETRLITTLRTYTQEKWPTSHTDDNHANYLIAPMNSGDTAFIKLECSGGAKVVSIESTSMGSGVGVTTYFSGTLLN